ncbi:Glycine cleavage system H protein [hydrothermal vent metagenome]|uniref:Glycine cleavage system H protein n=1 Tax=hydrothermal vent metagenome TaxID=652676 RepID=A0A3B0Y6M4_9ZZZZ
MSEVPSDLHYTSSHEWVRLEEDGTVTVGITDHAQEALGDLVFVEPPEIGSELAQGEACCVIESVKAASDIYMPISGEIIDTNNALVDEPEIINSSAYGDGWIFKIKPVDEDDVGQLMDPSTYESEQDD